jgi:hypothetical protein
MSRSLCRTPVHAISRIHYPLSSLSCLLSCPCRALTAHCSGGQCRVDAVSGGGGGGRRRTNLSVPFSLSPLSLLLSLSLPYASQFSQSRITNRVLYPSLRQRYPWHEYMVRAGWLPDGERLLHQAVMRCDLCPCSVIGSLFLFVLLLVISAQYRFSARGTSGADAAAGIVCGCSCWTASNRGSSLWCCPSRISSPASWYNARYVTRL